MSKSVEDLRREYAEASMVLADKLMRHIVATGGGGHAVMERVLGGGVWGEVYWAQNRLQAVLDAPLQQHREQQDEEIVKVIAGGYEDIPPQRAEGGWRSGVQFISEHGARNILSALRAAGFTVEKAK